MTQQRVIFTTDFWVAATERALKTAGQTGGLALGTVAFTNIEQIIPAVTAVSVAIVFGLLASYLTSLASAQVGNTGPSLSNEILVSAVKDDMVEDFDPESMELPSGGHALNEPPLED